MCERGRDHRRASGDLLIRTISYPPVRRRRAAIHRDDDVETHTTGHRRRRRTRSGRSDEVVDSKPVMF
jgi:hypothetical protein